MENKTIAFIGLGAMGFPMAKRLCEAGYHLNIVQHKRRHHLEELIRMGATLKDSVAGACMNSNTIISILPTDKEMEEVLLEPTVLKSIQSGSALVEMTSGSSGMMKLVAREFQSRGCKVLDAPVSGGTLGAANGTLTVMAGGCSETVSELTSVLNVLAKKVFLVGEVGDGKVVKAINQMLAGTHMVAASEAIRLARHLGVDMNCLKEVISASSGSSWIFTNKIDSVMACNFEPGFKLNLMKKDVQIALDEGNDIPLPVASLVHELYELVSKQFGDMDFSAISMVDPKL